ncbi:MAG: glycosyltransferase family 2 protein [Patescibacteria group bacterium]|nr:glycosyltransferase family 2 protein [Patescibacteria group bacterium]MDD4610457.1 glycosyltransferase family 2 protein [Patescibacteria group bacterium]
MNKKIAIIIINYKDYAERFLTECRDSLRAQNYPKELMQVYLIDNATSEKSKNYLNNNFPEVIIISRPDGNYSAANNAGIFQALKDGFEYFVIANMDVKFDSNWLPELVKAIESSDDIGIAQSKILLYPKSNTEWQEPQINSLGNIMHFLGFGFTDSYGEPDREIAGLPEITGYASGCALIVKKEVIEKIGGYNEEYYMYHDDVELGWKTKLAGYKIILAPRSIVYHKYEFSRSVRMLYFMERNRYLTLLAFYKLPTLILIFPALFLMECGMFFYSIINGWFSTKIKVYLYFLNIKNWKKIFAERKKINKFRVKKDRGIIKNFSGKILFQEIDNPVLKYVANPILNIYWQIVKRLIWW